MKNYKQLTFQAYIEPILLLWITLALIDLLFQMIFILVQNKERVVMKRHVKQEKKKADTHMSVCTANITFAVITVLFNVFAWIA